MYKQASQNVRQRPETAADSAYSISAINIFVNENQYYRNRLGLGRMLFGANIDVITEAIRSVRYSHLGGINGYGIYEEVIKMAVFIFLELLMQLEDCLF